MSNVPLVAQPESGGAFALYVFPHPAHQAHSGHILGLGFHCTAVHRFHQYSDPHKAGIVNAANCRCLGGGGVDGAITSIGGVSLRQDRLSLEAQVVGGKEVRCYPGHAMITGPNNYSLHVPYVI